MGQPSLLPYPVYNIFININNGCNLRCSYCWYNKTNPFGAFEEMSQELFRDSLECIKQSIIMWRNNRHFFQYPMFRVAIATKEPLLSFNSLIKPVLDDFDFRGYFSIYLLTNATLLTQEIVDWCADKGIVIQTSIDGCETAHNLNRMSHKEIVQNLQMIKDKRNGLFIVATLDKNAIPYVKKNLEFFRDTFPETLIKFNFNIFKYWTDEDWQEVLRQYGEFISENDCSKLRFFDIYKEMPPFIDEGRGYVIGIDRHGKLSIKKPFHSSIPKLPENEILNRFNYGSIYNVNYPDWIEFFQIFGRDFSNTRFQNLDGRCANCVDRIQCFNCDYAGKAQVYWLSSDECKLKTFRHNIAKLLKEKENL